MVISRFYPILLLAFVFAGCKNTSGVVNGWVSSPAGASLTLQASDNTLDINEGGSAAVLILATTPATKDTQYTWSIQNADARFSAQSGSGTLASGQSSFSINFNVADDSTYQGDTTAILEVTGPEISSPVSITLHIHDLTPALSIADVSIAEDVASGVATLTVITNRTSSQAISFDWVTSNGSATAGFDYTASSGVGIIPANASSTTFTVPLTNDATNCEGPETFTVTLSNASNNAVISDNAAIVTIQDDDGPTLSLSADNVLPGVTAAMTATLSATCASDITFNYATANGTASAGTDYTSTSGVATITAGQTTTTINVTTASQTLASSKTYSLNLSNVTSKASPTSTSVTATIAAPSLDLDLTSAVPASVTFSRASAGTYFDANRILRTASADQPRFDHDPITGIPLGLLIEESKTNLLTRSTDFASNWTASNSTLVRSSTKAPDATSSGVLWREDSTNSSHSLYQTSASFAAGSKVTYSVFVKPAGRTSVRLNVYKSGSDFYANFDLTGSGSYQSLAANGSASAIAAQITALSNGWYRASVSGSIDGTSTAADAYLNILSSVSGSNVYTGNNTLGLYIWGAQLEVGIFPTSYIPTVSSTVARVVDSAQVTDLTWFNSSEGVLVGEATSSNLQANSVSTTQLESVASIEADANNRIQIRRVPSTVLGTESGLYLSGGTLQFNHGGPVGGWDPRITRKQALGYQSTKGAHAYDGTAVESASALTSITPTLLSIGQGAAISAFNGPISHVSYYRHYLNSASMQQLTTRSSLPILYVEDATASEGGNLTFTIQLSSSLASDVTVNWAASSGTATLATDVSGSTSGTVTIPSGSTSATFSIATVSDSAVEDNETLSVALSGLPSSVVAGDVSATGTILDATLNIDFAAYPLANGVAIPADLIHSRSTAGTYFDSSGVLRSSIANILTWSRDFSSSWINSHTTLRPAGGSATAPDGSDTTMLLVEDVGTGTTYNLTQSGLSYTAGRTLAASVYVKSSGRNMIHLRVQETAAYTDRTGVDCDLATKTTVANPAGTGTVTASGAEDAGNGWVRCWVQGVASTTRTTVQFQLFLHDGTSISYDGDGKSGVYVWGPQLQSGSSLAPYVPTMSATNYAPRYDYDPVTHVARGLLVEASSTNLITNSSQFGSSPWNAAGATVTQNSLLAPDGTASSDTLAQDATLASHRVVTSSMAYSSGTNVTGSIFAKAGTNRYVRLKLYSDVGGSDFVQGFFDLNTGSVVTATSGGLGSNASASIANVGNGWYRISASGIPSSSGTSVYMLVGHSNSSQAESFTGDNSDLYIWGAQLEQKRASTSYIPTTTAAVTRNSDFLYANTADWFSETTWTALLSFSREHWEPVGAAAVPTVIRFNSTADPAERIRTEYSSDNQRFDSKVTSGGSSTGNSLGASGGTWNNNQVYKVGMTKNGSNITQVDNSIVRTTGAISTVPKVDVLYLGGGVAGGSDIHLRTFYFFPRVLTNTQLQDLTQ